jgi:hypothetical protein
LSRSLLSWELAAPHHSPTVPRPRRRLANLTFAATNGIVVSFVCLVCYLLFLLPFRRASR